MIVFDLTCDAGHRFEGWFASSDAFADQQESGLIVCPNCGSLAVTKAPMAPAVPAKTNARREPARGKESVANTLPAELATAMRALAAAQAKALESSTWVGDKFADTSRAMHYGEQASAVIHGQATRDEAVALAEEGIAVSLLPFPVAPPDELN